MEFRNCQIRLEKILSSRDCKQLAEDTFNDLLFMEKIIVKMCIDV